MELVFSPEFSETIFNQFAETSLYRDFGCCTLGLTAYAAANLNDAPIQFTLHAAIEKSALHEALEAFQQLHTLFESSGHSCAKNLTLPPSLFIIMIYRDTQNYMAPPKGPDCECITENLCDLNKWKAFACGKTEC